MRERERKRERQRGREMGRESKREIESDGRPPWSWRALGQVTNLSSKVTTKGPQVCEIKLSVGERFVLAGVGAGNPSKKRQITSPFKTANCQLTGA